VDAAGAIGGYVAASTRISERSRDMTTVVEVLESKVKQMCRFVAEQPHGTYHFEMGRPERLGYHPELLDRIRVGAAESFAGVGYVFGFTRLDGGST
jgi:arsenite methyltransferase